MQEQKESREWIQYLGKAAESFMDDMRGIVPNETYQHFRASRKEFWLGVRSLVDKRVRHLEDDDSETKVRKIEIQ